MHSRVKSKQFNRKWIELKVTVLREISQTQTNAPCFPHVWDLDLKCTHTYNMVQNGDPGAGRIPAGESAEG